MRPLLEGLAAGAALDESEIQIAANGPVQAFEALCGTNLDIVMAARFISDAELSACEATGVTFIENVLAYQALVVVSNPALAGVATCTDLTQLDALYGVAAEGSAGNTAVLDSAVPTSEPLTVYVPTAGSAAYELLAALLPSGEVRTDGTPIESAQAAYDALTTAEGAGVAVMTLAEYSALNQSENPLNVVQVRNNDKGICFSPTLETLESADYVAARPLALYSRVERLEALREFLAFAFSNPARDLATAQGFTAPSDSGVARNLTTLTTPLVGRTFSRPAAPVTLDPTAVGEIVIGGTPLAVQIVNELSLNFSNRYASVTLRKGLLGVDKGYADLCAGTVSAVFADRAPSAEESAACQAAGINLIELPMGVQGLVFVVASTQADLPTCLTTQELVSAFTTPLPEDPNAIPPQEGRDYNVGLQNWNALNPAYPDKPLAVFLPARSSFELDWLISVAGTVGAFGRSDFEDAVFYDVTSVSEPVLYRAASVANFDGGGLGILTWKDYQASERREGLRLLAVDNGAGCIAPNESTLTDGTYPLAANFRIVLSDKGLEAAAMGAYAWSLLEPSSLANVGNLGLLGFDQDALNLQADALFVAIREAQARAAQAANAESTAEPSPEATAEATIEVTPEATAEVTPEATEEPTATMTPILPTATPQPTAEASPSRTPRPTRTPSN
jgi:phosphate transport system substrate-binding protein